MPTSEYSTQALIKSYDAHLWILFAGINLKVTMPTSENCSQALRVTMTIFEYSTLALIKSYDAEYCTQALIKSYDAEYCTQALIKSYDAEYCTQALICQLLTAATKHTYVPKYLKKHKETAADVKTEAAE